MPKKVNMLHSSTPKKKKKITISADFECVLVPVDNWKQNPESYTNKYQKHVACSQLHTVLQFWKVSRRIAKQRKVL